MVGRDAGIVRIKTVGVNSVYDNLAPVTTRQLSHSSPHILDISFALQLAQTAPVVSLDVFSYALCQRTRLLYTSMMHQAILLT